MIKTVFAALMLVLSPLAICETYLGLQPFASLKEIKEKFPNAVFSDVNAAWLQPNERFTAMTGEGLAGTVYLKLSSFDPIFINRLEKLDAEIALDPGASSMDNRLRANQIRALLARPIDHRFSLDWLRWIPPAPIPMSNVQSKYGKPDTCDYDGTTFKPYCKWTNKAIYADVSDKKDFVLSLEFSFTKADVEKAQAAYGAK